MDIKQRIISIVESYQGLKSIEIIAHIPINETVGIDMIKVLDELVMDGCLIEIEYELPTLPNRIKSFYLPKGSKILSRVS